MESNSTFDCQGRPKELRQLNEHFGLELTPEDGFTVLDVPEVNANYSRPWKNAASQDLGSTIKLDKDKFQVILDLLHFEPEEVEVKLDVGYLIVRAKHEEIEDKHSYVSRSLTRKYILPKGVDRDSAESSMSEDGVLSVSIAVKPVVESEQNVPIVRTGPVKDQVEES